MSLSLAVILLIIGFALLTKGADYFIENSASFAEERGISPHVVGVTIVAFGTSLPELLVSIISLLQGYNDLALGNIVGSNMFNLLGVLGISATIKGYELPANFLSQDFLVMIDLTLALFVISLFYVVRRKPIPSYVGYMFILSYIVYMAWLSYRTLA